MAAVTVDQGLAAAWWALLRARGMACATGAGLRDTEVDYRPGDVLLFGTEPQTVYPSVMSRVRLWGQVAVSNWDLTAIATTAILLIGLHMILRYTRDGQFMVAVPDHAQLARSYGIRSARPVVSARAGRGVGPGKGLGGCRDDHLAEGFALSRFLHSTAERGLESTGAPRPCRSHPPPGRRHQQRPPRPSHLRRSPTTPAPCTHRMQPG